MEADLDALLAKGAKLQQQSQSSNQAKIQKVQPYLRERTEKFTKYYFPKLVSIGPIHHPKYDKNMAKPSTDKQKKDDKKMNLEQGEEYKKMWATMYLKKDKQKASQLRGSIRSEIKNLKELYNEDVIQGFSDDELVWILFVDGCAILHFMNEVVKKSKRDALDLFVQHDLLLLENQLPYEVLKILNSGNDATLREFINSFLELHHMIVDRKRKDDQREPTHLLDLLRTTILPDDDQKDHTTIRVRGGDENLPTHRNIQELITSGLEIKPNSPDQSLTSIHFRRPTIFLSKLTVDDFTAQTFLNMIAYEMCPDFKNEYEISNYVLFLNSLIDNAEDVKELRKAKVLHNLMGSDEEVAEMFNTVSTDMVLDTGLYDPIRREIEKYYTHQWKTWFTELRRKHFHSPWAIIALIATVLGFTYTVFSFTKEFTKD